MEAFQIKKPGNYPDFFIGGCYEDCMKSIIAWLTTLFTPNLNRT